MVDKAAALSGTVTIRIGKYAYPISVFIRTDYLSINMRIFKTDRIHDTVYFNFPAVRENRAALTFQQSGGAVKALSPKARPFCDRQVVPTEGGLRGSLLHAVPVP